MDYRQLIDSLTPEIYHNLVRAIEIGRWPDGRPVTTEQREHALQAVIAWGEANLPPEQRIGYIDRGHKAGEHCDDPTETALTWKD